MPVLKSEKVPATFGGESISFNYIVSETGEKLNRDYLNKAVSIYQERLKKLSEISGLIDYFFKEKLEYDRGLLIWKSMTKEEVLISIDKAIDVLSGISDWDRKNIEKSLLNEANKIDDRGKLLWPLRVALSGKQSSAGPFEIAEILGKQKTINRLKQAKIKL